ncbi:hypothetical protein LINPERPRIM_LOCUS2467 [Linum perenne]
MMHNPTQSDSHYCKCSEPLRSSPRVGELSRLGVQLSSPSYKINIKGH